MVHNMQLTKCLFEKERQIRQKTWMMQQNLSFGSDLVVNSTTVVWQLKRLHLHMY